MNSKTMKKQQVNKLWGEAFNKKPKEKAVLFAAGRDVIGLPPADEQLIPYEIKASIAWVKGLSDQKIIDKNTLEKIIEGLEEINSLYSKGEFHLDPQKEDVHSNIESYLVKKYGIDIGGKIHSGRSRSEQGIVDIILYLEDKNLFFKQELKDLIGTLNTLSKKYQYVILPAYTHHQHATVTTFGNMLDCYAQTFKKDLQRFNSWNEIEEISPLGSTAAYGTTFSVDKKKINQYLKLQKEFTNEIEAITFKGDAEAMMVFNLSMFMNHLSSLAQTLIIFSTKEFGFIHISDEYTTGSSIMPQKKNPDPLEVMKAKAAMCQGYLMSLLSMKDSVFIGYNRDLQWVKYVVMDAISEVEEAPEIIKGVLLTMKIDSKKMQELASKGFILAQAIMEGLSIDYAIPMRLAKMIVSNAVKNSNEADGIQLKTLNKSINEYGFLIKVSKIKFSEWIDPYTVARKQMKKEGL